MLYEGETVRDALHAAMKGIKPNQKKPASRSIYGEVGGYSPQKTRSPSNTSNNPQSNSGPSRAECQRLYATLRSVASDMNTFEQRYRDLEREFNRIKDQRLITHLQMIGVSVAAFGVAGGTTKAISGIASGIRAILGRRSAAAARQAFGSALPAGGGLGAGGAFLASLDNLDDIMEGLSLPNLWRRQNEQNAEMRTLASSARLAHAFWQHNRRNWRHIAQQYEESGCEVDGHGSVRRAD